MSSKRKDRVASKDGDGATAAGGELHQSAGGLHPNAIKLRGAPTETLFTKPDAQNRRCIRFCIRG